MSERHWRLPDPLPLRHYLVFPSIANTHYFRGKQTDFGLVLISDHLRLEARSTSELSWVRFSKMTYGQWSLTSVIVICIMVHGHHQDLLRVRWDHTTATAENWLIVVRLQMPLLPCINHHSRAWIWLFIHLLHIVNVVWISNKRLLHQITRLNCLGFSNGATSPCLFKRHRSLWFDSFNFHFAGNRLIIIISVNWVSDLVLRPVQRWLTQFKRLAILILFNSLLSEKRVHLFKPRWVLLTFSNMQWDAGITH